MLLFSHVKRLCFRARPHVVFHYCLYKKNILPQLHYSQVYFIPFTMLGHALWFWLRFWLWFIAHSTRVTRDKRVKTIIFVTKEINT